MRVADLYNLNIFGESWFDGLTMTIVNPATRLCESLSSEPVEG